MPESANQNKKKQAPSTNKKNSATAHIIVGVGASAGGLEALQEFFENLPDGPGVAFVIVQHLSPDYKSLMGELLSRHTRLKIQKVTDGMTVEVNNVYLIPPRNNMTIFNGNLFLTEQNTKKGLNLPIDVFLQSLAKDQGKNSIGIILSGTGSDGTHGIRAIKEAGGMVMVQDNETAKFDGMPRSSISTGLVDYILSPEKMPTELLNYVKHPFVKKTKSIENIIKNEENSYTKILAIVRDQIGVDFSSYKHNTILRRLEKRLSINQVSKIDDYVNILMNAPMESRILYKELLIGVTRFFRDKEAYKVLKEKVIPGLFQFNEKRTLRVWSAGCSTGEEAYSLAILLKEYMANHKILRDVKVFATDIDKDAIEFAGAGLYPENIINDVSKEHIKKYFTKTENGYQINDNIRKMVVFATHNILGDPPFSKIDFISCRNLFIYLVPEVQSRLLSMFYFALNQHGYMFLGSSETIGDMLDGFETVNSKWKIYKYKSGAKYNLSNSFSLKIDGKRHKKELKHPYLHKPNERKIQDSLLEKMINHFLPPTVIIDDNYDIQRTINDVSRYIKIRSGAFSNNLLKMLPPAFSVTMNSLLRNLKKSRDKVVYDNLRIKYDNTEEVFSLEGFSFTDVESGQNFYGISFRERADQKNGSPEDGKNSFDVDESYNERIIELERELQLTKESLQATVEELETSNEELQSSNEELIASNEELQSTNEELQSVNEELYTVNSEHQNKIEELTELNNDMNNLLDNIHVGTLFLDEKLIIRKFSKLVNDITNIRKNDIGRPINHISIEHLYKDFIKDTEEVIRDLKMKEKEILGPDKNWYLIRMLPYRNDDNAVEGVSITFIDIHSLKISQKNLENERELLMQVMDASPLGKTMLDAKGNVIYANNKACEIYGLSSDEILGGGCEQQQWKLTWRNGKTIPDKDLPFSKIKRTKKPVADYKHYIEFPGGKKVLVSINGAPMFSDNHKFSGAVFTIEDITAQNQ